MIVREALAESPVVSDPDTLELTAPDSPSPAAFGGFSFWVQHTGIPLAKLTLESEYSPYVELNVSAWAEGTTTSNTATRAAARSPLLLFNADRTRLQRV